MYRPIAIRFSYHFTYLISPLMTRHDTLSTCIITTSTLPGHERPIAAIVYNGIAAPNSSLVCRADSSTPSRRPAPLLDVLTS